MTSISTDGATDRVYISQVDGTIYYKINNGILNQLGFPLTLINTNATPASYILQVYFTTDITLTTVNDYFNIGSNGIQFGSESVREDGTKNTFIIDEVTDYPGLINARDMSHIYVYNLHVSPMNGTTLEQYGGWIGRSYYSEDGSSNYIINCSSDGTISNNSGGIVGSQTGNGGNLTIIGCSSSGNIGSGGGGIAGQFCGSDGQVNIRYCSSSGNIGQYGGGIVGQQACYQGGQCNILYCYSTGIINDYSGGIVGRAASGTCSISYCYSRGNILGNGGGIIGGFAGDLNGTVTVVGCYSIGTFTGLGGGIFGANKEEGATQTNCYVANGTWSDSSAIDAELNTETVYQIVGIDEPYELRNFGPNPYLQILINNNSLETNAGFIGNTTGDTQIASVLFGFSDYSILSIDGNTPSQTPFITINSTTGLISITNDLADGVYIIIVRAVGSYNPYVYSRLSVTLTFERPPPPTTTLTPRGKGFNFETYGHIELGKTLINERLQNKNMRFKSFEDYNKYRKAFATLK